MSRREARERGRMLDDVVGLIDDARRTHDGVGLPTLHGTVDGHPVLLRLVLDSLTLRKLPVLWLEITHRRPLPVAGPLTVLLRPQGTEFFSPDGSYDHELGPPPGCPTPVRVSTPDPARAPDPTSLAVAADLLRDPRTKELGVGPRGLRVVHRVAESEQASYRFGRRAVFGPVRVDPDDVRALLDHLRTVARRLDAAPTVAGGSRR